MTTLWIDQETYSETPIKNGLYRYLDDAEVMIVTWAIDNGPVRIEDLTANPVSTDLQLAILEADEVVAHNAMFDRGTKLLRHIPIDRWRCTMAQAMAHSLPGGLDKLCEILQVPLDQAKRKEGKELVRLFCMPRPKNSKLRRATRETHPAEWARFLLYAGNDILAMREVRKRMPNWNYKGAELALWHLDQKINDRGFAVDLELAEAALRSTDAEKLRLAQATHDHTDGEVASATQRDAMLQHILAEYNVLLPDMTSSTLERRIADPDLPDGLKELLRIRLQATTTSTSKYKALINAQTGGRLRGTLQFCGAGRTGRWAGRTFQPQNLSRVPKYLKRQWEEAVATIKAGIVDLVYDNPMEVMGSLVRGCIIAPPGRKLVVADLANIEGRVLAWLAGEEWKLQAFRDYDTIIGLDAQGEPLRLGEDLYKLAYAKAFGVRVEDVDDDGDRQKGKVMELALGFGGGVGAFLTFAAAYGIDLEEMAREAWHTLPDALRREAEEFYEWTLKQKRPTFGLSREAFVTCDTFKRAWRAAHPRTVALWHGLEEAAINAVENPGTTFTARTAKVRRDGAWLRIAGPSGRCLCYPQPKVTDGKLSYMGVSQYSRQWTRIPTYAGKLAENYTQFMARNTMAANMPAIDAAGYSLILTIHDEILTETPDVAEFNVAEFNVAGLAAMMSAVPPWAEGLPLAAAGFEAARYRKE